MYSVYFPAVSRLCDFLSRVSGGYPLCPCLPYYTEFKVDPKYLHSFRLTAALRFLLLLITSYQSVIHFDDQQFQPLVLCQFTGFATGLLCQTSTIFTPSEFCSHHNKIFLHYKKRCRSLSPQRKQKLQKCLQAIEGIVSCLTVVTILVTSINALVKTQCPIYIYSVWDKFITTESLLLLRFFRSLCS